MKGRLPPGPRLPAAFQSFRWIVDPIGWLEQCKRRYGDVFSIWLPGGLRSVIVSDAALMKEAFGDSERFQAGKASEAFAPFVGRRSLFVLDGDDHLRLRTLMTPLFHGRRLHQFASDMLSVARRAIDQWPTGQQVALHAAMHAVSFDIIMLALFGGSSPAKLSALKEPLTRILQTTSNPFIILEATRVDLGPWSPWGRFLRLKRKASELLREEFAARRAEPSSYGDITSALLEARDAEGRPLTDEEVEHQLASLMLAGHETTAAALTWAVVRTLQHPNVLARVREELDATFGDGPVTIDRVGELKYLEAVVDETMRHTPVFLLVARMLSEERSLGTWTLPAGTVVAPCIYLSQRNSAAWSDAGEFMPERFLERRSVAPLRYLPFGGGVRRCLGASFAGMEMVLVLAEIFHRTTLRLPAGYRARAVRRGVTLVPSGDAPILVDRKRPSPPQTRPQPAAPSVDADRCPVVHSKDGTTSS
jgi:cytochrome P450